MAEEEEENEDYSDELIYDTVLMRDTCGNSRPKIRNYFYHKVYDANNFKYMSNYDELILLDYLEGSKKKKRLLKNHNPFYFTNVFRRTKFISLDFYLLLL